MLTIFSTPKPFKGAIEVIQTNAILSWVTLRPACEVILFGNESGTAKLASELKIRHIADVRCNEYGTPLVNSMFKIAQDIASHELICYVNSDIILISDFLKAVRQVKKQPFLLVGRRWDIDLKEPIDFTDPDWEAKLQADLRDRGKLHGAAGIDFFVFTRKLYQNIPPFAIGRIGWDNWMIYQARYLKAPVIDATKAVTIIHQNHDYSHLQGGDTAIQENPEARRNVEMAGGKNYAFGLDYATSLLTPGGLRLALTLRHLYFRMRAIPVLYPRLHFLFALFKFFEKFVFSIRPITTSSR